MTDLPRHPLRLADLANRRANNFELVPTGPECAAIAGDLAIRGIRKLVFAGSLAPQGRRDWRLEATLGATVVQDCVVTLAPVTTRLDETVIRSYVADYAEPEGAEIETPEDDTVEPLPAELDLAAVMIEALALALPPFPRAPGADLGQVAVTEPGKAAMTDDDARPFAGLGALRDALAKKDGSDPAD